MLPFVERLNIISSYHRCQAGRVVRTGLEQPPGRNCGTPRWSAQHNPARTNDPMKRLEPGNYGKETSFAVRNHDTRMTAEEYNRLPKHPLHLILDNLRSAFNVGSIFRTADTARLASIATCGYTAHPPHGKLGKTALGTLDFIPTRHFDSALDAVRFFQDRNTPVWALETISLSRVYTSVTFPRPIAIVLGNEALGVSREVLKECEEWIEIPMYGYKNSLNVASACAVVSFEVLRQWQVPSPNSKPGG